MIVFSKIPLIREYIDSVKNQGLKVGFIPTMGALHEGHLEIIKQSKKEDDITVVSIFVNPTQFNDKNDYRNYPVDRYQDLASLETLQCDVVFNPSEKEMYPDKDNREFDFGYPGEVLEGFHRPSHFNGVAQIVSKLFDVVHPHKAYFGEKDYQQLIIIKKLVQQLRYDIEIVSAPVVREKDGLAMSSRNALLNEKQRKAAPLVYETLVKSKSLAGQHSIDEVKNWVFKKINSHPLFSVEYFDIVDQENLQKVKNWNDNCPKIGCIAVFLGKVRLIDNIKYQ